MLINAIGQVVLTTALQQGQQTIDVRGYAKGVYLLRSDNTTQKIVLE